MALILDFQACLSRLMLSKDRVARLQTPQRPRSSMKTVTPSNDPNPKGLLNQLKRLLCSTELFKGMNRWILVTLATLVRSRVTKKAKKRKVKTKKKVEMAKNSQNKLITPSKTKIRSLQATVITYKNQRSRKYLTGL